MSLDAEEDAGHDDEVKDDNDIQNIPVRELYMHEYCLNYKKDTPEVNQIHGIKHSCLPGHFFIADYGNKCIKLLDRDFSVVTRHDSLFQPWDIAAIDSTFFVVTFPFVRLMQKFKIKNRNQIHPWFPVKAQNEYYGVCADRDRIVATCKYDGQNLTDTPSVHVMDHHGNVELIVDKDAEGKRLFADPVYITLDESMQTMYVSDIGNKTVVSLNLKGDVLGKFIAEISVPRGISFDKKNGYIFVFGLIKESVMKLDQNLKPLELIKCKRETLRNISGVLYCHRTEKLIMSTNNSNIINVFTV